ncbi:hypothetical protein B0T24DRAFT_611164 [Lasiosphaeria ovina]|uniref:Uncharacterized protein n=1 Tax=Lasiosphaeria ovina TaxID=92902 RepID=A0AAE0ND27_9PEZI|nr:hypothetical protein B0T24DRAFT_611164 [Lasiosphaeria ovina]
MRSWFRRRHLCLLRNSPHFPNPFPPPRHLASVPAAAQVLTTAFGTRHILRGTGLPLCAALLGPGLGVLHDRVRVWACACVLSHFFLSCMFSLRLWQRRNKALVKAQ